MLQIKEFKDFGHVVYSKEFQTLKKVMPEDYSHGPPLISCGYYAIVENAQKAGPMELSKLVLNGKLTFKPFLKLVTNWTKLGN